MKFKNEHNKMEIVEQTRAVEEAGMDGMPSSMKLNLIKDLMWTLGLDLINHSRELIGPEDKYSPII